MTPRRVVRPLAPGRSTICALACCCSSLISSRTIRTVLRVAAPARIGGDDGEFDGRASRPRE